MVSVAVYCMWNIYYVNCCGFRYIDILSKYKPKIQWNTDTSEHVFTFK